MAIPARIPKLGALVILVDTATLAILAACVNLVRLSLHVVIVISAILVSLICQWPGFGRAAPNPYL